MTVSYCRERILGAEITTDVVSTSNKQQKRIIKPQRQEPNQTSDDVVRHPKLAIRHSQSLSANRVLSVLSFKIFDCLNVVCVLSVFNILLMETLLTF